MVSPPRRASAFINPQLHLAGIEIISRFANHNISIQSKIVQGLFEEVQLVCCVTENDFRIYPPTKPPSKT